MQESTVTIKGQTTLPKPVREALGTQPGDKLRYVILGDEVRIMRARPAMSLSGMLKGQGRVLSLAEMEEAIADGARE